MGNESLRSYRYDTMKAVLIFLVVFGHILSKFGNNDVCDILYKLIFSFHMPAFLFITGHFARYNPKDVFRRMFPLYVIFQLINMLATVIEHSYEAGHFVAPHIRFFTPRYTLWYLFAIMAYQLLIPLITTRKERHRPWMLSIAIALGVAMGWNGDTDNFMAMSRIVSFFPFYLLGYYEHDYKRISKFVDRHVHIMRTLTGISVLVLTILTILYHKRINSDWLLGTDSYKDSNLTWYIRLICYGVAFLWILFLLTWIPRKELKLMGYIGRNTLSIYLFHGPILVILSAFPAIHHILDGNAALMLIIAAVFVLILSYRRLEQLLRKCAIYL